jgi:hypothetical protein
LGTIVVNLGKQLEGLPNQPDDTQSLEIVSTMKKQIEELSKKTRSQEQVIASLRKKIKSKNLEIHRRKEETKKPGAANTTLPTPSASATKQVKDAVLKTTVEELLEEHNMLWFRSWGRKRKGKLLAEVFWDLMDGVAQDELMHLAKMRLRSTVFHPFNVLRAMDFAGGTLSYEGIEVLRECETEGQKYKRGTVIPCSAVLRRMAAKVEQLGDQLCPYELSTTNDGEMVAFDLPKTLPLIVEAHGLTESAKTHPIKVAQSIDGAQLTKHTSMVIGGVKINDNRACCPISKRPFADTIDTPRGGGLQSRNTCFPLPSKCTQASLIQKVFLGGVAMILVSLIVVHSA